MSPEDHRSIARDYESTYYTSTRKPAYWTVSSTPSSWKSLGARKMMPTCKVSWTR
jgi:hypothetical protein